MHSSVSPQFSAAKLMVCTAHLIRGYAIFMLQGIE